MALVGQGYSLGVLLLACQLCLLLDLVRLTFAMHLLPKLLVSFLQLCVLLLLFSSQPVLLDLLFR